MLCRGRCKHKGLGKTLQTLAVIQNQIFKNREKKKPATPSLILAPPTLTEHWLNEIKKFLNDKEIQSVILNSKMFKENGSQF